MGRRIDDPVADEEQASYEPILLTIEQAAALAQVGADRVREWMREPGFPMIRTPHQVRIHLEGYKLWLARKAGVPA